MRIARILVGVFEARIGDRTKASERLLLARRAMDAGLRRVFSWLPVSRLAAAMLRKDPRTTCQLIGLRSIIRQHGLRGRRAPVKTVAMG